MAEIVARHTFNDSYNIFFETFRTADYIKLDFNKLLYIYISVFQIFRHKRITECGLYSYVLTSIPDYLTMDNKLIIRPGIVELRACSTDDYKLIVESLSELSKNINNELYIVNKTKERLDNWLSTMHDLKNYNIIIALLMTNAGFYISNDATNALENFLFFKNHYINAIINADYIMHWPFVNCYALNILNNKKKIKDVTYINLTDNKSLVLLFDNKQILFLTPFKTLVDIQYNSKNLYKLRRSNNLSNVKLDTIEAFLTTYPNKKHNNFIETYTYYINEIDTMFSKNSYDVFTCSCGCYGIILCDYVYRKYNITCVYIGNRINEFFGILFKKTDYDMYYIKSDLDKRYLNVENIENNLYGYKE